AAEGFPCPAAMPPQARRTPVQNGGQPPGQSKSPRATTVPAKLFVSCWNPAIAIFIRLPCLPASERAGIFTTVYQKVLAGDEAGMLADEKREICTDLRGTAVASHRVLARALRPELLVGA